MDEFFDNYGFVSSGILNVTPREALELCGRGAVIVDVREEYLNRFKNFGAAEVLYIPLSMLPLKIGELPRDRHLILADSVGLKSKEAVILLMDAGFTGIANMAGGIADWERDGLPVVTNIEERLSGSCLCQLKPRERVTVKKKEQRQKR